MSDNFNSIASLIDEFLAIKEEISNQNKETSFLFNPLRFFGIGETKHSFLLAKILNPNGEHGQGNMFLNIFLDQIAIQYSINDKWVVTAEKGRIDILIKRIKQQEQQEAVIVIENKSNNAIDQECQIYRYWLQEMFIPNKHRESHFTLNNKENYRLIYLCPNTKKLPDSRSLEKPKWDGLNEKYSSLPDRLYREHLTILSFRIEIVNWLEACINKVKDNYRMKVYLEQYLELWKKN